MQRPSIPLFKVHMPPEASNSVTEILHSGYVAEGPQSRLFEQQFAAWVGNPHTAVVNSGTSAITLALRLAGVGPGDEVITSPMTCLATNEPILTLGAQVVWADVQADTGNIDPAGIAARITSKTRAILFVDWSGMPCDLDAINQVAQAHGLKTIEDAAHALGSTYNGQRIGNHADYVCFSFQAIKHLTTVDGGALTCRTAEDCDRAKSLRWFGSKRATTRHATQWEGDVVEPGYKMHMNDVAATIGLAQMPHIDSIVARHRANANVMRQALAQFPNIELLRIAAGADPSYWIFTLKLPGVAQRDVFSSHLQEHGIANSIVHTRNDQYSLFSASRTPLPQLNDFSSRMLNIPCGWWLSKDDVDGIIATVEQAAHRLTRA